MAMENTAVADLWRDSAAPTADRVKDLIPRMSVREKVAQLYGVWVGADATRDRSRRSSIPRSCLPPTGPTSCATASGSSPGPSAPRRWTRWPGRAR